MAEYSVFKYFKENVGGWVKDAVKDGGLLGSQGNMALSSLEYAFFVLAVCFKWSGWR